VFADDFAADVAPGGCRDASAVDHVHTRAACLADLRHHVVRLMKWRERHGLRRRCDGQGKDNSDQPDHSLLPSTHLQEERCSKHADLVTRFAFGERLRSQDERYPTFVL
jgi:hypothetical protein